VDHKITDKQLLEKISESDKEAFRELFIRYQPIIFRQVMIQTGEQDLSHDIVQETFIRVWEHRKTLKPSLSFFAYILRISRNIIRDHYKYNNIRERLVDSVPPPASSEGDHPEEALHYILLQEKITAIVRYDIPKRCREIFLLSRFEGKTNQEIAVMLQLSVRTVEHQIASALRIIRKKLKDNL
jgi:RNA polymerase sigma-70 factor (family 1)